MSRGNIIVHEANTGRMRLEYVVSDGEPYANGLIALKGIWNALAINEGAIMYVRKGRRAKTFVRVSWVAEVESDEAKREMIRELRRRLLVLHSACDRSPDGEVQVDFGRDAG